MMKIRDDALAKYRKNKSVSSREYYKQLKSLVIKSLHNEKAAYFCHSINNKINNPKTLWKNLKRTVLPPKQTVELPPHFNDANEINNYFLDVPGEPQASLSYLTYFEFHRFGDATFTISSVSQNDILRVILSLKSNAIGIDNLSLKMIIMTLPKSLEIIHTIINKSILTSAFPDLWKIAIVRPLPKNNNPLSLKDIRPISILPCLSKVLEKIVCQQLTEYLERKNILPPLQSGFRKRRSTTTALIDVVDNILSAQDEGMCTLLVLLDYSRAFDAINIPLLLSKMSFYGFGRSTLSWFNSYLSNRKQLVSLCRGNETSVDSNLAPVNRGVPQGSILGPILFNLYCADLPKNIVKCQYHMYADDTQLYISFKPSQWETAVKDLNDDLKRVTVWSEHNCLLLNPDKTNYMIFGTKNQLNKLPEDLDIVLKGKKVKRVNIARNLGLKLDEGLRFEEHVAEAVKNCFYRLKVLYKIRPYLSEELRVQLVETLVLSKLNYADAVYGPRLLARTERLVQRVQNACARFCFTVPFRGHVTPFFNDHAMLKMKSRQKLHLACLLFGVIKHQEPSYLYNKLGWVATRRQCDRRQCSQQLSVQKHKSASFKGAFRYAASKIWNNIPPPLRQLSSITTFKSHLKLYLLNAQKDLGMVNTNANMSYI